MDAHFYTIAVTFLALRPRTEKEIRDHLKKNKASEEQITTILSKLREQKFVNDEEFAQWWFEQRMRFRPKGWRVIELELKQKGIHKDILHNLSLKINQKEIGVKSELESAKELTQKNIKKYQGLSRQQVYSRLGGFLARRGFDLDVIRACIDEVLGK